ncbi:hypothetical protein [Metabacillus litoralis]|uniref:hypothetical protein n=1 Tax=Metabacillus litoralis TaxID=152268 RepID=UPI002041184A|nr:hypothetical protein [Metabacillus litoralis]MCM3160976.1 hypothetical protein [Metabacillus litoralis]
MRKNFIQKGEQEFINGVVKAVLKKDVSKQHILIDHSNVLKYITYPKDHKFDDIVDNYGRPAKMLCVFSERLITDFHYKAGNDDLARPWARKAIKSVIEHGKKVSKDYYENNYEEFRKEAGSMKRTEPKED